MRAPHHLPNHRDGGPADPNWLPHQRAGISPQMIGRYPDFDVMASSDDWDEATRKVVMDRLQVGTELHFFTPQEAPALRAFCDALMAQDREPRVPVAEMIDEKLVAGRLDGFQFDDMPDDRDTWRLTLAGLDEIADGRFADLALERQEQILERFADGDLESRTFKKLNVSRAWSVCTRMVLEAFYSHPWAWNEIGFGGPAYPRGYMRLGPVSTLEPSERPGATDDDPVKAAPELEL